MAIDEIQDTGHITVHYFLSGNANNPKHPSYRSDNPWQKMTAIRDQLRDPASQESQKLGVTLISTPDESVWRLMLNGDVSSSSLERAALAVLALIETRLYLLPDDDIRAVTAENAGVMREWKLSK